MLGPRGYAVNVEDAVSLDGNGNLVIKTYTENGTHYTGMIKSINEWTYGKFEARIDFNDAQGEWSSFWLTSPTYGNPIGDPGTAGVEIDIVEHRAKNASNNDISAYGHNCLHWDGYGDYHLQKPSGLWYGDCDNGYHIYTVEWTPTYYKFYCDGQLKFRQSLDRNLRRFTYRDKKNYMVTYKTEVLPKYKK